jgi:TPR repeat protein
MPAILSKRSRFPLTLVVALVFLPASDIPADTSKVPDIAIGATQYEEGRNYFAGNGQAKDLNKARTCFEIAAGAGHPQAKGALGYMLLQGLGGPKDELAAHGLLDEAANAGITSAQVNLGGMYEKGSGVPRDLIKAVSFYERAAKTGSVDAQLRLMDIHYFGADGIPADHARALPHVKAAAVAGNARARNILGTMCEFGQGMEPSKSAAIHWFREAAIQGDAKAQGNLGRLILAAKMKDREIVEAYRWLKLAASQGDEVAKRLLSEHVRQMSPQQIARGDHEVDTFKRPTSDKPVR